MSQSALFDTDEEEQPVEETQPQPAPKRKGKEPVPPRWERSPGIAEPLMPGASWPERWAAQDTLRDELAGFGNGTTTTEELLRFIRGTMYVFDANELVRIGNELHRMLAETDERERGHRGQDSGDDGDEIPP